MICFQPHRLAAGSLICYKVDMSNHIEAGLDFYSAMQTVRKNAFAGLVGRLTDQTAEYDREYLSGLNPSIFENAACSIVSFDENEVSLRRRLCGSMTLRLDHLGVSVDSLEDNFDMHGRDPAYAKSMECILNEVENGVFKLDVSLLDQPVGKGWKSAAIFCGPEPLESPVAVHMDDLWYVTNLQKNSKEDLGLLPDVIANFGHEAVSAVPDSTSRLLIEAMQASNPRIEDDFTWLGGIAGESLARSAWRVRGHTRRTHTPRP